MKNNNDKSWIAAVVAGVGVVAFATLFVVGTRSFRAAIAEMAESGTRVTIVNADGSIFYDTDAAVGSHAAREEVRKAFAEGRGVTLRHSETVDKDLLYCARRVGDRVVRLAVPYTGVLRSERLAWCGLGAALLLGVSLVAFIFVFTRRMSRRLERQSRELAIAAANEEFRREFTSNVTHELKSPITAIVGAVEMLGDGTQLSADERQELFAIVSQESGRLGALVKDVLSLAEIERDEGCGTRGEACAEADVASACGHAGRVTLPAVPFEEIVADVVGREAAKARAAHVQLNLVGNDAAQVRGDALRLEEVLVNLIENALRYSGSERIDVKSVRVGGRVHVSVTDYGVGIPAEHLPHLFERFYRVSKSRSRSLGGTGLGLAIVKHIVQLHGGTVAVASDPGRETVFSFNLPLAGDEVWPVLASRC